LVDVGSVDQAIQLLEQEISSRPKNADAHIALGFAWRAKGDMDKELESFRSALKASPKIRDKIVQELLKEKHCAYGEMSFIDEIDGSLVKKNESFAYRYLAQAGHANGAAKFADYFPKSNHAPEAILKEAKNRYGTESPDRAKALYQRLVRSYPKSDEARTARKELSDWWTYTFLDIGLDGEWRSHAIRKGQAYRYMFQNEVTIDLGVFGIQRIDGQHTDMYIGTSEEAAYIQSVWSAWHGESAQAMKSRVRRAGNDGSGVAPRDGRIWFRVDMDGREYRGSLQVKLYLKE
jgi:tetratricopeptide (TPR) repeat protein